MLLNPSNASFTIATNTKQAINSIARYSIPIASIAVFYLTGKAYILPFVGA